MGACMVASKDEPNRIAYITQQQQKQIKQELEEQEKLKTSKLRKSTSIINKNDIVCKLEEKSQCKEYSPLKNSAHKENIKKDLVESNRPLPERKRVSKNVILKEIDSVNLCQKSQKSQKNKIPSQMSSFQRKDNESFKISDNKSSQEDETSAQNIKMDNSQCFFIEDAFVETAENRINLPDNANMLGKGLSRLDNNMILSTIGVGATKLSVVHFKNGSAYIGEWLEGARHGRGECRWADGSKYIGEWWKNKSHGKGRLEITEGQAYEGNWIQDVIEGEGTYFYTSGATYTGKWIAGKQQGYGVEEWSNGQLYLGMWASGMKHGKGQLQFEDGSYYKGDFAQNQLHGEGVYHWKDCRTYTGEWEHNRINGDGKLQWQNGCCYQGEFKNDKMHGLGLYKQADGSSFKGTWQFGRRQGVGEQIDVNGNSRWSQWYIGKRIRYLEENEIKKKNSTKKEFRIQSGRDIDAKKGEGKIKYLSPISR